MEEEEDVWSADRRRGWNHKVLCVITYVVLSSVSIIKKFFCEMQTTGHS